MKRKLTTSGSSTKLDSKTYTKYKHRKKTSELKNSDNEHQIDNFNIDDSLIAFADSDFTTDLFESKELLSLPDDLPDIEPLIDTSTLYNEDKKVQAIQSGEDLIKSITDDIKKSENQLTKLLRNSLRNGDTELSIKVIDSDKFNPNSVDEEGNTPLHFAAWEKHPQITKKLIEKGAAPKAKNCIGNTPMHMSCLRSQSENIDILYAAGARINEKNNLGYTPMSYGESVSFTKAVKCLDNIDEIKKTYSKDVIPDFRDEDGNTALHYSVGKGMLEVTKLLLEKGFSPQIANSNGKKPEDLTPRNCRFSTKQIFNQHATSPQLKTR